MIKSTIVHLDEINEENFTSWIDEAFMAYAISVGDKGRIQLGVDGHGVFTVKHNPPNAPDCTYRFKSAQEAIEKYKELHY